MMPFPHFSMGLNFGSLYRSSTLGWFLCLLVLASCPLVPFFGTFICRPQWTSELLVHLQTSGKDLKELFSACTTVCVVLKPKSLHVLLCRFIQLQLRRIWRRLFGLWQFWWWSLWIDRRCSDDSQAWHRAEITVFSNHVRACSSNLTREVL